MTAEDYRKPSDVQEEVSKKLGIDISGCGLLSAGAKIEEYLYGALHPDTGLKKATDAQKTYAKSLGIKNSNSDSSLLLSAKIEEVLLERNVNALMKLNLQPGNTVVVTKKYKGNMWKEEYIVSSIGKNKRVYFKGIGCKGAWPTEITSVK